MSKRSPPGSSGHAHLVALSDLLRLSRAGALFPELSLLLQWVELLARPLEGRTVPPLDLDGRSGFPTAKSLLKLSERQRLARAFFEAHRVVPSRDSRQFNEALAAIELPRLGAHAKLVSADRKHVAASVTVDHPDTHAGEWVRWTVQLRQRVKGPLSVERGGRCTLGPALLRLLDEATQADATAAVLRLSTLEGLEVGEVVRGALGPCVSPAAGALGDLAAPPGEALLSVAVERVGRSVGKEHLADPWAPHDPQQPARAALGLRRSRERKLYCTVGWEADLVRRTRDARILVRSR